MLLRRLLTKTLVASVLGAACSAESVIHVHSNGAWDAWDSSAADASSEVETTEPMETLACSPLVGEPAAGAVVIEACFEGQTCVPFVDSSDAGAPSAFGTRCVTAGDGVEGAGCWAGGCIHGLICTDSDQGSVCATVCRVREPNDCRDGFTCQALQLGDFGGCVPF